MGRRERPRGRGRGADVAAKSLSRSEERDLEIAATNRLCHSEPVQRAARGVRQRGISSVSKNFRAEVVDSSQARR